MVSDLVNADVLHFEFVLRFCLAHCTLTKKLPYPLSTISALLLFDAVPFIKVLWYVNLDDIRGAIYAHIGS